MNKKLMKLTIALLGAIMITVPLIGSAQACGSSRWRCRKPVTKEPVTLSRTSTGPGYVDFFGDSKNVEKRGDNYYIAWPLRSTENWVSSLTFADGTVIEFVSQTDSYIVANLDTLKGRTITKWTLTNDDGKFKGTLYLKTTYYGTGPPGYEDLWPNISTATSDYYGELKGYGAYAGQKIVLSGTGLYSGPVADPYEGSLKS